MAKLKTGTTIDGNTAWHAGNDGTGSGLSADNLRGYLPQEGASANSIAKRNGDGDLTVTDLIANGDIYLTGTATTTNQARTIDFTGFDKEGTTDFSDRAYIQHTINTGGHSGSVLVLSSQNDSGDGIAFLTNASSQLKHNSNVIWDAGNDGAGSGLDADLLDGKHASEFAYSDFVHNAYIDFTVNGNADTYYPVSIAGGGQYAFQMYSISRQYNWTAPNTWNTSTHRGGLTLTWQYSGDSFWGGNDHDYRIIKFDETYTTMVTKMAGSVGGNGLNSGIVVWLRGGGALYRFHGPKGKDGDVNIHLTTVTGSNGQSYAPMSYSSTEVTNTISVRYPIRGEASLYDGNNKVWHAGNDGAGSGLDADTLDTYQASQFLRSDTNDTYQGTLTLHNTSDVRLPNSSSKGISTSDGYRVINSLDSVLRIGDTGKHNIVRLHGQGSDDFRVYYNSADYEIWHEGNDGPGSGLNADLLDGQHGSYYLDYNNLTNKPTIPTGDITSVTAGSGLTGGGTSGDVTISHADTSTQASVNNSGRTYIQDITLDTYGHITGITSATETVTNYTHPTHPGDDISIDTGALTGATVISDLDFNVTTDTLGHVTDANATVSTRNLTASDVGAAPSSHNHAASEIVSGEFNTARMGSGTATSGYVLKSDGDGTASWQADNNTTYTLGSFGITATAAELNKMDGVTATTTELNYTDGVTSNIQTQLNNKANASALANYLPTNGSGFSPSNGDTIEYSSNAGWFTTPRYDWVEIKTGSTTIATGSTGTAVTVSTNLGTTDIIAFEINTNSVLSYSSEIIIMKLEDASNANNGVLYNAYASTSLVRVGSINVRRESVSANQIRFSSPVYIVNSSTVESPDTVYIGKIWKLNGVTGA